MDEAATPKLEQRRLLLKQMQQQAISMAGTIKALQAEVAQLTEQVQTLILEKLAVEEKHAAGERRPAAGSSAAGAGSAAGGKLFRSPFKGK